ncbi:MAG TPA: hypothetical protein VMV91_14525 [Rhodocyclaceae bacterium]|nr:hypothetical protein [Rhodocyclaceae bacterium]
MLLLGVCVVPAVDAVKNAIAAPQIAEDAARALLCVNSHMEKILAEPYQNLLNAAGDIAAASTSYSLAADSDCPARNVYIARYNPDAAPSFVATDTGLLYLTVSSPDPSVTPPGTTFAFTVLLSR